MDVLKRDFGPGDLLEIAESEGLDGVVSVQARTIPEETESLLAFGKKHPFIKGVVGWIELTDPKVGDALEKCSMEPLIKGFRHVLQGESDERYMLREDFNRGVAMLHNYGFVYDILIKHFHLPHTPAFVDQHEGQVFVIDHIAKPRIETDTPDPAWVSGMREIARRGNVYCKVSGMVTEVVEGVNWSPQLLQPYFETVLEAFGPDRLMFGSDWPVCLLASDYHRWIETVRSWTSKLSTTEQAWIMGGTATEAYQLA
tara:strand:+ start:1350 stop:2117 length:768 start_codon:yes stop_codon:yes gene_type:complete